MELLANDELERLTAESGGRRRGQASVVGLRPTFLAIVFLAACLTSVFAQEPKGRFVGELIVRVLDDGRLMELVKPFSYVDKARQEWPVPAGTRFDGASIPSGLGSIIGTPFTGKYRRASVIHDYYCLTKSTSSKATHLMFYEAMLSGGESKNKAMLIYYAVVRFGPRWEVQATGIGSIESQRYRLVVYDTKLDEAEFAEVRQQLDANTITLSDLERQASARRQGTEVVTCSETLAIPGRSIKCRPAEYGSRLRQEPGR